MIIIRFIFCILFTFFVLIFSLILFKPILFSSASLLTSNLKIFNFILEDINLWHNFKIIYVIFLIFDSIIISNILYSKFLYKLFTPNKIENNKNFSNELSLLIGKNQDNRLIYIPEKSLY